MARKTRREPEHDAHAAGADYAREQLAGAYFQDWVWEQMVEAERMRAADPSSVLPLETPADARKVARNMLQQLGWDTKRELKESKEFFEGFDEVLRAPETLGWLADIILNFNKEARGGSVQESNSTIQVDDRVRAHWTHGGRRYSAIGTVERVLKHDVKVKLDEDAGDHFKRGFVVTVPIEKSRDNLVEILGGQETREAYGRRGRHGGDDRHKQYEEEWQRKRAEYQAKVEPLKAGLIRIVGGDELLRRGMQIPTNGTVVASLSDPRRGNEPVAHFRRYPGFGYGEDGGIGQTYFVDPAIVPAGRETRTTINRSPPTVTSERRSYRRPIAPYYSRR